MRPDLCNFLKYDFSTFDFLVWSFKVVEDISANRGRTGYTGKGGDDSDRWVLWDKKEKIKLRHFAENVFQYINVIIISSDYLQCIYSPEL